MYTSLYSVNGKIHTNPTLEKMDSIDKSILEKKYGKGGEWLLVNEENEGIVKAHLQRETEEDCTHDNEFHGVMARD